MISDEICADVGIGSPAMQDPDRPIVTTAASTVYTSPWWTVEEHAVIDVDGQPGMYNVLLARTPASMAGRLITGNEITHAASLVCLLTHFGRDGRPS